MAFCKCGKKLSFYSKKCLNCYHKTLKGEGNPMFGVHRFGKDSPRYIDGRKIKSHYCVDCNKKLTSYTAKRCGSCAVKYLYKIGKLSNEGRHLSQESKKKMSLTKGGTGIPHEFNKYPDQFFKIRYWILKRDNHICQNCKQSGNEVHHIDHDKDNNKENNLITLCRKCNMKANKNKDYWKAFYQEVVHEL